MARFGKDLDDFKGSRCVHIRSAEQTEHFTVYIITITIGSYNWTVKHRYSEFYDLHEKLSVSHKLDKTLLPPKKIFGNQTESFIKKRQRELEIYLQTVIMFLAQRIPSCLAYFLDFDKYEIHGITQAMAEDLYTRGEMLLHSRDKYEVSILQLYSLTERLKLPEPTCDSGDVKKDLGHILDYITRAKRLKVTCSKTPVGSSNIMMNKLPFDLTLFKSLQSLETNGCNFRLIYGLDTVKQTLVKLGVQESASSMKEILLQDAPHWRAEDGSAIVESWNLITEVDLSSNSFTEIHESIQLMPKVEKLNLSHNMIESIQNLQWLSQLTHLDLSHNNIRHVDSLHTKMGNIKCLRLVQNQLESLHGFAKLFSLQTLDVSYNKIASIEELRHVSQLPCMEELSLEGNPVMSSLDYRTKTLQMFGDRVAEIILDGKPPNQKELDTVAVLQALRKAKDGKMAKKMHPKKNTSVVSLSDMYGQSPSGSLSDQPDGNSSHTASPAHGILSGSVPSNMPNWHRKDSSGNIRSSSPYSQDSYSYSSVHEAEDETLIVSDAYPYDTTMPQMTGHTSSATKSRAGVKLIIKGNNIENAGGEYENNNTYLSELVPEAHPFDLTIENPASFSSSLDVSSYPGRCVTSEQMSHPCYLTKPQPLSTLVTTTDVAVSQSPPKAIMTIPETSMSVATLRSSSVTISSLPESTTSVPTSQGRSPYGIISLPESTMSVPTSHGCSPYGIISLPAESTTSVATSQSCSPYGIILPPESTMCVPTSQSSPNGTISLPETTTSDATSQVLPNGTISLPETTTSDATSQVLPNETISLPETTTSDATSQVSPNGTISLPETTTSDATSQISPNETISLPETTMSDATSQISPNETISLPETTTCDATSQILPNETISLPETNMSDATSQISPNETISLPETNMSDATSQISPNETISLPETNMSDATSQISPNETISLPKLVKSSRSNELSPDHCLSEDTLCSKLQNSGITQEKCVAEKEDSVDALPS